MEQTSLHTSHTKPLTYVCAQPAIVYYEWHLEVMIHNFRKHGIRDDQMHIVLGKTDVHSQSVCDRLQQKFPTILFSIYDDLRPSRTYISSLRPHILKKHFAKHPYLHNHAIFYHDCDMIFTRPVQWDEFISDDTWYLSDTISYIGAKYIKSKGLNILQEMCDVIGVSREKVEAEEDNSGGAQYILKNITADFWDKVEQDSEALTKYFNAKANEYRGIPNYHPIQAWTADMWAVLWNGWYFGHDIRVVEQLDFCWPTSFSSLWEKHAIYHNAGVTGPNEQMFYKAIYTNKYPTGLTLDDYRTDRCSYYYAKEIIECLG